MPNIREIKISRNQIYCTLFIELRARIRGNYHESSDCFEPQNKSTSSFSSSFDHPCHLKSEVHLRPMHRRERHPTFSNDAAAYCCPLKLSPICLQQTQKRGRENTEKGREQSERNLTGSGTLYVCM